MSARRWPIYTMQVGDWFIAENPPSSLARKVSKYGRETGKRFKTKQKGNVREVRRVA